MQKEPWQLTKNDILSYAATRPKPRVIVPGPATWSEQDLAAHKLASVRLETLPPEVPVFEVGTWCIDGSGWLWHLEEWFFESLRFVHGNPFDPSTWGMFSDINLLAVEKYAAWLRDGFEPPPLEVWQMPSGAMEVKDGYNRSAALATVGRDRALAWVSPYRQTPAGIWETLTHRLAVEEAIRGGKDVPAAVLAEYPDLAV